MSVMEFLFQMLQSYLLFRETITVDIKECETCTSYPRCHYRKNEEKNLTPLISRKDGSCSMRKPAVKREEVRG